LQGCGGGIVKFIDFTARGMGSGGEGKEQAGVALQRETDAPGRKRPLFYRPVPAPSLPSALWLRTRASLLVSDRSVCSFLCV